MILATGNGGQRIVSHRLHVGDSARPLACDPRLDV